MTPHRTKDTGQGPCRKELDRLDTRQPVGVGAAWRLQQGFSEPADKGAIRPVRRRPQKIDWRGIDGGLVGPFIAGGPPADFADRTARHGKAERPLCRPRRRKREIAPDYEFGDLGVKRPLDVDTPPKHATA